MAQQVVNVGTAPNSGNGDPIRVAFQKTNANTTELYSSIPVGAATFGTDSGVVNAYVYTHSGTVPVTLAVGTLIRLTVNTTNTTAATLNADGTGAVAVIRANGSVLTGGELSSLGPVVLQSTGTQWQIVSTAGAQPGYEKSLAESTAGVSTVSGISQAASAVITFNTVSLFNPYIVGQKLTVTGVVGMTQINGLTGTVSAIGGSSGAWTVTVNINSSAFSAYGSGGTLTLSINNINYQIGPILGDVRRYQAVGDGVTDDSIALKTAFDVASANVGTFLPPVYVPRPTVRYLITQTLPIGNSIEVYGDGKYASFIRYTGTGQGITTNTQTQTNLQVSLRNFTLEITGNGAVGIDASRMQNSTIQSVRVANSATNGAISGISQAASAVITLSNASGSNPFSNGQTVLIGGVVGMTQINGLTATVSATGGSSGAWTVTVNINSTAFSAYASGGTVYLSMIGIQANANNNNSWLSFFNTLIDITCDSLATGLQLTGSGVNLSSKNLANRWRVVAPTFLSCGNCFDGEAFSGIQIEAPYFDQNTLAALKTGPGTVADGLLVSIPTMETESGGYFFDIDPTTNRLQVYGNRYYGGSLFKNSNGFLGTRAVYQGQWDEGIQWTDTATTGTITGITQANPAVVTINTVSGTNPFSVNETVYVSGVSGMTQINGLTGTVSAVGGSSGAWTISVGINASAFSAWTSGGTLLTGFVALNQLVPAAQSLSIPKNPLNVPALNVGDTTDATFNATLGRLTIAVGKSFIAGASELFPTLGTNPLHLGTVGVATVGLWTNSVQRLSITGAGAITFSNSALVVGNATGGTGYGTGAGGTVTQLTSRTTGVTLNKICGAITMFSAAGSATPATFTVTDSQVAATDTVIVNQASGTNVYELDVTAVAAGSFNITFFTTGGVATDAPVINFSILKAVTA